MVTIENINLNNILLADDGSPNMRPAIQFLADLPHFAEHKITSLRVFTPIEGSEYSRIELEAEKTKNLLVSRHLQFKSELIQGYPSETIMNYGHEHNPDLIVMGSKSAGKFGGFLGNVATNILHSGRWPVLIAREPYTGLKRVLLVTDGSDASQYTCKYLGSFPLPQDSHIDIMHVVTPVRITYPIEPAGLTLPTLSVEEEASLNQANLLHGQEFLEKAHTQLGNRENINKVLKLGDPLEQILSFISSENIDLLVCGSRGSGNLTGWLMGSLSRDLVRQAGCSVLVVRTPGQN
ncbi:MAG: universal stress protein [Chloroflexota bacterium]